MTIARIGIISWAIFGLKMFLHEKVFGMEKACAGEHRPDRLLHLFFFCAFNLYGQGFDFFMEVASFHTDLLGGF